MYGFDCNNDPLEDDTEYYLPIIMRVCEENMNFVEAFTFFGECLSSSIKQDMIMPLHGMHLDQQGTHLPQVESCSNSILLVNPSRIGAQANLAALLMKRGHLQDSQALAEKVLDTDPDNSTALICLFGLLTLSHRAPAKISMQEFIKLRESEEERKARFLQDMRLGKTSIKVHRSDDLKGFPSSMLVEPENFVPQLDFANHEQLARRKIVVQWGMMSGVDPIPFFSEKCRRSQCTSWRAPQWTPQRPSSCGALSRSGRRSSWPRAPTPASPAR